MNSLTGRVVVDGDVAGSWGRVKGAVARAMARAVDFRFSFRVIAA